jgi:hypothetical protein
VIASNGQGHRELTAAGGCAGEHQLALMLLDDLIANG